MEKQDVIKALDTLKNSSKRKFKQSIDLIMNLKGLDMKKPDHNVDVFAHLHFTKGKPNKVCALVGPELLEQAKEVCDGALALDEITGMKDKREIKKLANQYDFFVAQATIMPKIATAFGRVFGPRGKMPNPKAGCVVPPNANLKQVYDNLQKTLRVSTKNAPTVKCAVGIEDQAQEEVVDNVQTVYNAVIHALPGEADNIKNVSVKLTMGKPVLVEKGAGE